MATITKYTSICPNIEIMGESVETGIVKFKFGVEASGDIYMIPPTGFEVFFPRDDMQGLARFIKSQSMFDLWEEETYRVVGERDEGDATVALIFGKEAECTMVDTFYMIIPGEDEVYFSAREMQEFARFIKRETR